MCSLALPSSNSTFLCAAGKRSASSIRFYSVLIRLEYSERNKEIIPECSMSRSRRQSAQDLVHGDDGRP